MVKVHAEAFTGLSHMTVVSPAPQSLKAASVDWLPLQGRRARQMFKELPDEGNAHIPRSGEVVLADTGDNLNLMATRTACLWQVICLL